MALLSILISLLGWEGAVAEPPRPTVLVVVGASGTKAYGDQFKSWAGHWQAATEAGGGQFLSIGTSADTSPDDRQELERTLTTLAQERVQPLWLVFIGHGTFDGKVARFNLRGPDVTLNELSTWLEPVQRPLAIINCASSSGPFLPQLSGPDRVVVVATKSGHEYNLTRFGEYLSAAIADLAADLDKDQQVSLLEAYLQAAARTREFYEAEGRLLTEHALLDDNGDRVGTPADWFQGFRAIKVARDGAEVDGLRAGQWHLVKSAIEDAFPPTARHRRQELESLLASLRNQKQKLPRDEYWKRVEPLLIELAELYESAESTSSETPSKGGDSPQTTARPSPTASSVPMPAPTAPALSLPESSDKDQPESPSTTSP